MAFPVSQSTSKMKNKLVSGIMTIPVGITAIGFITVESG